MYFQSGELLWMGARIVAVDETCPVYSAHCYSVGEGTLVPGKEIPLREAGEALGRP